MSRGWGLRTFMNNSACQYKFDPYIGPCWSSIANIQSAVWRLICSGCQSPHHTHQQSSVQARHLLQASSAKVNKCQTPSPVGRRRHWRIACYDSMAPLNPYFERADYYYQANSWSKDKLKRVDSSQIHAVIKKIQFECRKMNSKIVFCHSS